MSNLDVISDQFDAGSSEPLDIVPTGTLSGDVELVRDLLDEALLDCTLQTNIVLSAVDPAGTLSQLAALVSILNVQLIAQGFRPPEVHRFDDPHGFLRQNAAFLTNVATTVEDVPVTRH